ncbi:MAG: S-methyl-5'-thioinosine phosphorylase, partial [Hydrogenoanaerobacterium sp.]
MQESIKIGIIGGTGVYQLPGVESLTQKVVETPYGIVKVNVGIISGKYVAFLTRHGEHHSISPGQINYRANIWALKTLGVKQIFATACSGSLNPNYGPGTFVLLEQFIEMVKERPASFYYNDGSKPNKIAHVDLTHPYCARLGDVVSNAGKKLGIDVKKGATYCCVEGPRFESDAEIKMLRMFGADLVAQTNYPEVALAREAEMCYTAIGLVSNMAAGISGDHVTATELKESMSAMFENVQKLLAQAVALVPDEDCWCQ